MICYKTKYFKSEIYSHSTKLNILNLKYGPPKSGAIYCRVREYALREKVVKKVSRMLFSTRAGHSQIDAGTLRSS